MPKPIKYVAIGDSFTEGVGDETPSGVRGWADLVAQGIADATGQTVLYANLAIRGRLLRGIVDEQLRPALNLEPTLVSFNGGGNDMLRPKTDQRWIINETNSVLTQILGTGSDALLVAGGNPTAGIPGGKSVKEKGDSLVREAAKTASALSVPFADNWNDETLARLEYWSADRLHLATIGHRRVAANVLKTLGYGAPKEWTEEAPRAKKPGPIDEVKYVAGHVLPWIGRRLTGKSSGDGRTPKYANYIEVHPRA